MEWRLELSPRELKERCEETMRESERAAGREERTEAKQLTAEAGPALWTCNGPASSPQIAKAQRIAGPPAARATTRPHRDTQLSAARDSPGCAGKARRVQDGTRKVESEGAAEGAGFRRAGATVTSRQR